MKVEYEGPTTAKIALIGEAPGADEVSQNRPFVGRAGSKLMSLLNQVGLCREDVRLMNVCRHRPEGNNFAHFWIDKKQTLPSKLLKEEIQYLKNSLLQMPNLELVICLGRQATFVLSGLDSIMKLRGSIIDIPFDYTNNILPLRKKLRCLFTLHPSFLLRNPAFTPIVLMDLRKGLREKNRPSLLPTRKMVVYPTPTDWFDFVAYAETSKNPLSIDIETRGRTITRLGMCVDLEYAISIPFQNIETNQKYNNDYIWTNFQHLLNKKLVVGQNFINYDLPWLESFGCHFPNPIWDTMIAQHCILPGLPKSINPLSLAFLASIYTNEPYYKDEAKSQDKKPPKDKVYGEYNCKDVFTTLESYFKQREILTGKKFETFKFETKLARTILHDLTERGVLVDVQLREKLRIRAEKECEYLTLKVVEKAGRYINLGSPKQLASLLYTDLKLKPVTKKNNVGKVVVTTDEEALKTLKTHPVYSKYRIPELDYILQFREVEQLRKGILSTEIDKDNRIRCTFKQDTDTGRLASTSSPFWTGQSLHTIPRSTQIRKLFLPDSDVWVHRDLSQAEAWLTYYEAGATKMLSRMEDGKKPHQIMASLIGGKKYEESGKGTKEYALGKSVVHASNYLIGPKTLARTVKMHLGISISMSEARRYIQMYYKLVPEVPVWHLKILHELKTQNMILKTCLGRERQFFGFFDGSLKGSIQVLHQAVAFKPQSTIGDLLNLIMLKWKELKTVGDLIVPVHDEMNTTCTWRDLEIHLAELDVAFNYPLSIGGRYKNVVIPWDTSIQKNWGEEFKK
jgi:uracil-DNA glycosylase family 4